MAVARGYFAGLARGLLRERRAAGKIGLEGFRYIMTAPRFKKIPKVLETRKGKEMKEDVENMATLISLMA